MRDWMRSSRAAGDTLRISRAHWSSTGSSARWTKPPWTIGWSAKSTATASPCATTWRLAKTPAAATPSPTATSKQAISITSDLHAHDAAHPGEAAEHEDARPDEQADAERVGDQRREVVRIGEQQESGQCE